MFSPFPLLLFVNIYIYICTVAGVLKHKVVRGDGSSTAVARATDKHERPFPRSQKLTNLCSMSVPEEVVYFLHAT